MNKFLVGLQGLAGVILMKMRNSDAVLLRRYVETDSNEAFEALISRHSGLVYSAALRQLRNPELAEDVAQSVFIDLAQKAKRLPHNVILSGWLYRATLFTASKALRSEQRRTIREQEAHAMELSDADEESVWKQIEPYLDSAMRHLGDQDRTALVLRYFENNTLRDVGKVLGTSEDAAQKRVARALEKLRALFARRKISISSTALAGGLSTFAVEAAPAVLASTISTAVSSVVISSGGIAVSAALLNNAFMITKLKIAIAAGVAVAAAQLAFHQKTTNALQRETEMLQMSNQTLQDTKTDTALPPKVLAELAQLREKTKELPKLRGEIIALRQENKALRASAPGGPSATSDGLDESTRTDPTARMHLADELIKDGNYEEALTHLVWCYDEGIKHSPSFVGVRSSFLLSTFAKLGDAYPPAKEALIARRDEAVEQLMAGSSDRTLAMDVTRLNSALGEGSKTVALFDQIPKGDPARGVIVEAAFDELLKAKKYEAIFAAITPEAYFEKRLQNTLMIRERMPDNERLRTTMLNRLVLDGGMAVETLAGANQPQRAIDLIDQVMEQDASRETIEDLLRHATRAENAEVIQYLESK